MLKTYIAKTINRTDLSAEEAREAMNIIMTGQATPSQIGAYLVSLRMKGETIPEITGSVRASAYLYNTLEEAQLLVDNLIKIRKVL